MPDSPGLPLTNMLVGFDSSMRYEHIPHPFPLLPYSNSKVKEKTAKKGFFGKLRSSKEANAVPGAKEQYQMALAFNAATNVDRLGNNFKGETSSPRHDRFGSMKPTDSPMSLDNKLLDAFQALEKSVSPSTLAPADARLGRWILLYAVLQVLSTLSVDIIGLKFSDKIRYFASPSLDGCPPWRSAASNGAEITPLILQLDRRSWNHEGSTTDCKLLLACTRALAKCRTGRSYSNARQSWRLSKFESACSHG